MFDLNPFNLPDAQMQQWIMMIVAGMLGFFIGYIGRKKSINQLEDSLDTVGRNLNECQRGKVTVIPGQDAETTVLNRIRSRAHEIDFAHIGVATADSADDLKVIMGIGPFLEKKLNAIDIYTFQQIANFTKDDIERVNDIIEFFPGRIERDNWVGQASDLTRKK